MDPDAFAVTAFLALWCLTTLGLSALPIVAAIKRRAWRALAVVIAIMLAGHVGFFWWSAAYSIKQQQFWSGAFLYMFLAPALPLFLWRLVRMSAEEPKPSD